MATLGGKLISYLNLEFSSLYQTSFLVQTSNMLCGNLVEKCASVATTRAECIAGGHRSAALFHAWALHKLRLLFWGLSSRKLTL